MYARFFNVCVAVHAAKAAMNRILKFALVNRIGMTRQAIFILRFLRGVSAFRTAEYTKSYNTNKSAKFKGHSHYRLILKTRNQM